MEENKNEAHKANQGINQRPDGFKFRIIYLFFTVKKILNCSFESIFTPEEQILQQSNEK